MLALVFFLYILRDSSDMCINHSTSKCVGRVYCMVSTEVELLERVHGRQTSTLW